MNSTQVMNIFELKVANVDVFGLDFEFEEIFELNFDLIIK